MYAFPSHFLYAHHLPYCIPPIPRDHVIVALVEFDEIVALIYPMRREYRLEQGISE